MVSCLIAPLELLNNANYNCQNIKEGIDGRPATWYSDIFDIIFPNLDTKKANIDKASQYEGPDNGKKDREDKDNSDESD